MSIINWDSPIDRIERRMNQLFDHIYNDFASSSALARPLSTRGSSVLNPAVNIYETDKAWAIHAELPGVKKEDIKIDLQGDTLTISGETKFSQEFTKDNARYQERREGVFSRTLTLPDNVDRDKIQAKYENGILELQMPKSTDSTTSRRITIQ